MPIDPAFVEDCPYAPDALLIDEIVSIDRDAGTIVARMPTSENLPLTRDQRAHPLKHPRHISGGLLIHATGMMGFAHAYFLLGLRHADGWIGYGTHVHEGRFRKMAKIGDPLILACTAVSIRKIQGALVGRYKFRFTQTDEVVYEGEQSAIFTKIT
jgi:hypothetical protein